MARDAGKKKRRKDQVRFSSAKARTAKARNRVARGAARWAAWCLLVAIVVTAVVGAGYGLKQLLFVHNDHFVLKNVDVQMYGELKADVVREKLAEMGLTPGETNLFAIDMHQLRQDLELWHVQISRVRVHRRLPDTLALEIYERNPVAQLLVPRGLLLDSGGLVLPKRNDPEVWYLPVITGVRSADQLTAGTTVEDELVNSALKLLELISTQEYGQYLDVNLIQLDQAGEELKVYLREKRPFREGACVVLPAHEKKMKEALARVNRIVHDRLRGRQPTGFINATFERNIPVTRSCALQSWD